MKPKICHLCNKEIKSHAKRVARKYEGAEGWVFIHEKCALKEQAEQAREEKKRISNLKPISEYIQANADAVRSNPPPLWPAYEPLETWRYIIRMIGAGFADYPDKEIKDAQGHLYGSIVVTPCLLCHLLIPVDNKQVIGWIWEAITQTRAKVTA